MMAINHRSILKRMMTLGVGVLVAAALLEVLSAAAYSIIEGGLVYRREGLLRNHADPDPMEVSSAPKVILHPVLGFVNRPGLSVEEAVGSRRVVLMSNQGDSTDWAATPANEDGFFSPIDYPWRELDEHDFVVGVFGGSVAQWLAVQTGHYLESRIEELEGFEDRRVRVLTFAQGGFKYPQQIQALSYFSSIGQRFNVVIDISGFNEIALGSFNASRGIEAGWPSMMHLGPLLRLIESSAAPPEAIGLLASIQSDTARAKRLESLAGESRLASMWFLRHLQLRTVEARLSSDQVELALSSSIGTFEFVRVPRRDGSSKLEDACRKAALQWSRCALMMHALARSIDAEFIEVLQPNQYFSNHEFSRSERSRALKPRSVFREPVQVGYPFLQSAATELREEGIHVVDAIDVFDSELRPVFSDSCCHYDDLGNRILVDRIFEELRPVLTE